MLSCTILQVVAHLKETLEQVEKEIEKWIKPFATIVGEKIDVDINLKKENPIKYFLRLTLPNNFESYAIALHSYWINHNVTKNKIKEGYNDDKDLSMDEFTRVKWRDFYKFKEVPFELNTAILDSVEWNRPYKQLNNELYTAEGSIDEEHLDNLVKIVNHFYKNQSIELFYIFMSTRDFEKNLMFSGKINDLPSLIKDENLRLTPSLIYPKERNWVVNTDFDLAFSTIGGETKFINELVKQNQNEIIKVEY